MPHIDRRFSASALLGIVDQGLLSGVNLAIGVFFIAFADKTNYGVYAQLYALIMLSQSIQNALINGPWVTLGPQYGRRRGLALSAHLFRLQSIVSAAAAVVSVVVLIVVGRWLSLSALPVTAALAFAALLGGLWLREFARDFFFLRLQPERALIVYTLFSVSTLVLLGLAAIEKHIDSATVLGVLALSCWLSGLWGLRQSRLRPFANHGHGRPALAAAWVHSRWSLPSVIVSWAFANAHLFIAASLLGAYASANMAAARLLIMPAGVCVLGWSNIFLTNVNRWLGQGDFERIHRVLRRSLLGLWTIIVLYALVLWAGYGLLLEVLLGEKYAGLLPLAGIWAGYFMANAAVLGNNWILAAAGEYRLLFMYACTSFAITIPAMVAATWLWGSTGTLATLLIAQAIQLLMLRLHGVPKVKRLWKRSRTAQTGATPSYS